MYFIELPFLIFGIYNIFRKKLKWGYLLVGWILITPLALSPFLLESPNLHRSLLNVVPLEAVAAFGILESLSFLSKKERSLKLGILALVVVYAVSIIYFLNELFVHQPTHKPWNRNYPYKQLILDLKKYEKNHKEIIIPTTEANAYIFYLFYNKFDPKTYQNLGSHGNEEYSKLGMYTFTHVQCPLGTGVDGSIHPVDGVLYVNNGSCVPPKDGDVLETIYWGDGTPAFRFQGHPLK